MSRFALTILTLCTFAIGASARAQTVNPGSPSGANIVSPRQAAQQPGLAATTSGEGNMGTGASSDVIGTGNTQGNGVMSPQAPGSTEKGATGANPQNTGNKTP